MSDDRKSLQIYCKANNSTLFTYDSTSQLTMIVNRTRILKIILIVREREIGEKLHEK